jgi:hypothetical protein
VIDPAEVEAPILVALDVVGAKIEVEGARGRGGGLRAADMYAEPVAAASAKQVAAHINAPIECLTRALQEAWHA